MTQLHQSILTWRNYRYLTWFIVSVVASTLVFVSQLGKPLPPSGSTWQGYVLGTFGALLIIWLTLLGLRKRRYRSQMGTVQGWVSAHVYLGLSVPIVALMHSAGQIENLNIHTLTFWFMVVVIASGFFGLYAYLHVPEHMNENIGGKNIAHWISELSSIDRQLAETASTINADCCSEILSALDGTSLGGSKLVQLLGVDKSTLFSAEQAKVISNTDQAAIIRILSERIPLARDDEKLSILLNTSFSLFGSRQQMLRIIRKDMRYKSLLAIWLHLHIPFTVSLLIGLMIHVFVIFFYW